MDIENLNPEFNFGKSNEDVILTEEPAEIITGSCNIMGKGECVLSLQHKPSIRFNMQLPSENGFMYGVEIFKNLKENPKLTSTLKLLNRKIDINDGAVSFVSDIVSWVPLQEPFCVYGNEETELDYISFHLFNGVDFFSKNYITKELNEDFVSIWLTALKWDNWEICIKSTKDTNNNIKLLERNGGYALSHIGMIKKNDSSSFKIKDIQDLRSGLSFLLSFAMGRTCWPNLCVGYKNDQKVYEDWGAVTSSWSNANTWWHGTSYAKPNASTLEDLFPLFMNVWSNKNWQSALCEAIHWYLNSNDISKLMLEASLILQQAAIELLAFEYVVNDKKLISAEGFKGLWASDKFRLLFSSLGLPLDIPTELKSLLSISKSRNWEDVPHALTEIRNSIVHPEHKQKGKFSNALYEAWCLSLECLELSILGICGYKGQYQSRVKIKQLPVPWN